MILIQNSNFPPNLLLKVLKEKLFCYFSDDWPRDGEDLVEKVISINYDPTRKPMIALTGYKDKLRWQIATEGKMNRLQGPCY